MRDCNKSPYSNRRSIASKKVGVYSDIVRTFTKKVVYEVKNNPYAKRCFTTNFFLEVDSLNHYLLIDGNGNRLIIN